MIEEGMPHFQRQREAADSQPHSVFLKIAQYKEHVDPTNTYVVLPLLLLLLSFSFTPPCFCDAATFFLHSFLSRSPLSPLSLLNFLHFLLHLFAHSVLSGYSGGLRVIWHNGLFHLQPQQPLPQQQQQQRLTTRVILTPPEWFRRQIPWDLCLDGHLIACDNSNNNSNSKNNDSNSTSTKAQALLQIVNAAERLHKLRSISPLTNNTHSDDTQHDPLPLDLSYISDNNKTNDSNNNSSNLRTDGNNNRKSKRDGSEWWQHVQFVVMDSPDHSVRDLPFLERHAKIKQVILQQQQRQQVVVVPDVHMCAGVEDLCTYYERVIANGGQGVILRNPSALYLPGLPFMWLKNKVIIIVVYLLFFCHLSPFSPSSLFLFLFSPSSHLYFFVLVDISIWTRRGSGSQNLSTTMPQVSCSLSLTCHSSHSSCIFITWFHCIVALFDEL